MQGDPLLVLSSQEVAGSTTSENQILCIDQNL